MSRGYANMTDDPGYQQLVEELALKCTCTPLGDRPCAGLLAGGLCDDLHMGRAPGSESDGEDDCEPGEL